MPPDPLASRRALVALLRVAHAGERAAAHAYRGHARSVADAPTRERIAEIEAEEWDHRRRIGRILERLGERPSTWREARAEVVGRVLGFLCHVSGRFVPMYGAGRLERGNVREYEVAARHARDAGSPQFCDDLLAMAEVEWEHERTFRAEVERSALARVLRPWSAPPPKAEIRASFAREAAASAPAPALAG